MPGWDNPFGGRLRRLRESASLTQEELASRAGLSAKAISDLERGERRRPYPHTVRSLADALELSEGERSSLLASVPKRGATAPAASPTTVAPVLPTPPTPLVGRERDVAVVLSLLEGDEGRLVTLTGPGGVGKTRLALEVARASLQTGRFPDGVAFVALVSVGDPDLVVSTMAQALGLREAGGKPASELVQGYLAEKRLLLVLDNREHLLDAASELAGLLYFGTASKVLATSRAPLRLRGEREYPVAPLAMPDPTGAPDTEGVAASPAATLFVDRALAANPAFSVNPNNAAAVAAICWRLDGLPLALELAAAKARFLGPTEILSRLDQVLQAGGARDLPERQRTMRSTLDWSHDLLSEAERTLFSRLSVFVGGFTLEAAEDVANVGEALDTLGGLVEQSLVTTEPHGGEVRYGMLEPLRQYALERLEESGEEERVRARHADYYRKLAERAGPELRRAGQASWLDGLAREHDNVRAVLHGLLGRGEAGRVARIGWEIWLFWALRGHSDEGRRWMERALAQGGPDDTFPSDARVRALCVVAMLSFVRGEADRTAATLDGVIPAAHAANDPETLATALVLRGLAALSLGETDGAEAPLQRGLSMFRELDDGWGVANALLGLAQAAMARGDGAAAASLLSEAQSFSRAAGDWFTLSANLSVQALASRLRGEDEQAADKLRECVDLAAGLRDAWTVVLGISGLAGVAASQDRPERAARLLGAVEALNEKMGVEVAWSAWRTLNRRDLSSARERLGPEAFEKARMEGRAMTLEEAVAEALAEGV